MGPQLIAYLTERIQPSHLVTVDRGRVGQAPVKHPRRAGEERTRFPRFIARSNHDVEMFPGELVDGLAPLSGYVEAELRHHCDGLGSKPSGLESCAAHDDAVASHGSQEAFGHLRPRRVVHTEEEDAGSFHGRIMRQNTLL